MKLIMFHADGMQMDIAKNWAKKNQVEITFIPELLSMYNIDCVKGYDGLINSQAAGTIDERIYPTLHAFGIKQIALVSAGYDLYNLDLASKNDLLITNVPSYSPESIAEYTVLTALNLVRKNQVIIKNVENGDYRWSPSICGGVLARKKVAVIGVGRIGKIVAKLFYGFGCQVIGYSPKQDDEIKGIITYTDTLEEAIQDADIVTLHMPASKENTHLFDIDMFRQFKRGAIFLNMARGSIVDTKGLLQALDEGILYGVGIDTYENEQVVVQHTGVVEDAVFNNLIQRDNVMYSPHIAYFTDEAIRNMVEGALNACVEVIKTGTSKYRVN